jgi:galactokinase/mevalonate kinase-like predicted kinase
MLMAAGSPIRATAPGRCGIIGNPTDMYGGSVLSCSIPRRATVTLTACDRLTLETGGQTHELRDRTGFHIRGDRFDVPRAVLSHLRLYDLPVRLTYDSAIPYQGGLSGSTALVAATLRVILRHQGVSYHQHHFAELVRYVELNRMGIVCGYQDAYMVTFGGLNYMEFRDKEFYRAVADEPYATIESLSALAPAMPFILAHTGMRHHSGAVHKPLRDRWLDGEQAVVEGYLRIGKLAREGKRAFLDGDWERLARLMTENHAIQRELGGSGPENEVLIEAALDAGALAAKLAGAGSGGTIIALHPQPESLEAPLRAAGAVDILYPAPLPGVQDEPVEG